MTGRCGGYRHDSRTPQWHSVCHRLCGVSMLAVSHQWQHGQACRELLKLEAMGDGGAMELLAPVPCASLSCCAGALTAWLCTSGRRWSSGWAQSGTQT